MKCLKNLSDVPETEQTDFINSFDNVLSDIDGVIWLSFKALPGAVECIDTLTKLNKKVRFVTNNGLITVERILALLQQNDFRCINADDIVNPHISAIQYLETMKFDKELFMVSTDQFKQAIRNSGFKVAPDPPVIIEESLPVVVENIKDDENVGGVLMDLDLNINYIKLQKTLTYLKRKDCIFLVGGGDKLLPIGSNGPLLGPYYFHELMQNISGRQAVKIAKPSAHYNEVLVKHFNITDPKRTLFIGDSIEEDMSIANVGGYRKLLVLTGRSQIEDINNWRYPEEYKPDYYVESLDVLNNILKNIQ